MHNCAKMAKTQGGKLALLAVASGVILPMFADGEYAVTAATSSPATLALYTSAAATPTYAAAAGALASPFVITYKDGETVSVTSPNGVTTQLSGSDGTISYTPASGGIWKFTNSNGSIAYVGVGWNGDGFVPVSANGMLTWLDTLQPGPDRSKVKTRDSLLIAYSDTTFTGNDSGVVTLTLTSPSGAVTNYTKNPGEDAKRLRLGEVGEWTVALTTSSETSTARINATSSGLTIFIQ